jgi:hypothetical protein
MMVVVGNWILQGNPGRSDIRALIESGRPIRSWAIGRHVHELTRGDRAALWVSGPAAGIYVIGEVTGPSYQDVADDTWTARDRGRRMWFAEVCLDDFLDGDPISRIELRADRRFARARILTQPQGANPFLTTDDEWSVIEELSGRVKVNW